MHRTSRSSHPPRLKYHVHASPQHVATCQVDLPVLNFSSRKVTFPQFPNFNCLFCARRINATGESLFQKLARRINATSSFFCDIKRRDNATFLHTSSCSADRSEIGFNMLPWRERVFRMFQKSHCPRVCCSRDCDRRGVTTPAHTKHCAKHVLQGTHGQTHRTDTVIKKAMAKPSVTDGRSHDNNHQTRRPVDQSSRD